MPYGLRSPVALPSARPDREQKPSLEKPEKPVRAALLSQPDLAAIDGDWERTEPSPTAAKAPSVRRARAAPPRSAAPRALPPRPAERLRGLAVPILSKEHAAPIPMLPAKIRYEARDPNARHPNADPNPGIGRLAIAAISRETTSLAGVPTLKELLVARAEAREREELERRNAVSLPTNRSAREAPVLFPIQDVPTVSNEADPEASRALFAYGTLVGAIAVGLSVLVALLLK